MTHDKGQEIRIAHFHQMVWEAEKALAALRAGEDVQHAYESLAYARFPKPDSISFEVLIPGKSDAEVLIEIERLCDEHGVVRNTKGWVNDPRRP